MISAENFRGLLTLTQGSGLDALLTNAPSELGWARVLGRRASSLIYKGYTKITHNLRGTVPQTRFPSLVSKGPGLTLRPKVNPARRSQSAAPAGGRKASDMVFAQSKSAVSPIFSNISPASAKISLDRRALPRARRILA